MKKQIRHIIAFLSIFIPYNLLRKLANRKLIVVNYHSILGSDYDNAINKQPYRTAEQFEKDIVFFKKHYNIVTLKQILEYNKNKATLSANSLAITFDDGLAQVYTHFRPILLKHGVSAIIFINPPFIDQGDTHFKRKINLIVEKMKNETPDTSKIKQILDSHNINTDDILQSITSLNFHQQQLVNEIADTIGLNIKEHLQQHPLYLTSAHIKTMIGEGFYFGGHSWEHPNYKELSVDEQEWQTVKSTTYTADTYNLNYKVFAFPYRDYHIGKELFTRIAPVIDLTFGTHGMVNDEAPNNIQRIDVERSGLSTSAAMKLNYAKFLVQKLLGKGTLKRK